MTLNVLFAFSLTQEEQIRTLTTEEHFYCTLTLLYLIKNAIFKHRQWSFLELCHFLTRQVTWQDFHSSLKRNGQIVSSVALFIFYSLPKRSLCLSIPRKTSFYPLTYFPTVLSHFATFSQHTSMFPSLSLQLLAYSVSIVSQFLLLFQL